MNDGYSIGEVIQIIRHRKGLTIEQLAKAAGLHRNYISQIEHGSANPTISALQKVCNALGIELHFEISKPGAEK